MGSYRRVIVRIAKETERARLAGISPARADLGGLQGAVRELNHDAGANGSWISAQTSEFDAQEIAPGIAPSILKCQRCVVVASDHKTRLASLIEIHRSQGLGVTGHDQPAVRRRYRHEMAVAIAPQ